MKPRKSYIFWCIFPALIAALPLQTRASCNDLLAPALSFLTIDRQIDERYGLISATRVPNGQLGVRVKKENVIQFLRDGWPTLKQLAEEDDTTVTEMLSDYFTMIEFLVQETIDPKTLGGSIKAATALNRHAVNDLENAHLEKKVNAARTLVAFWGMSVMAYEMEKGRRLTPSFNPLDPIDSEFVERVLMSLEESTLDHLVALIDGMRAKPVDLSVVLQPWEYKPFVRAVDPSPAPPAKPVRQLAIVLKENLELEAEVPYIAPNILGRTYTVTLSPAVIKDFKNGDRGVIQRLLRGVLTGNGHKSGIKTLFDLGPKIVEVKGVLNGHKRLFGCLDGMSQIETG